MDMSRIVCATEYSTVTRRSSVTHVLCDTIDELVSFLMCHLDGFVPMLYNHSPTFHAVSLSLYLSSHYKSRRMNRRSLLRGSVVLQGALCSGPSSPWSYYCGCCWILSSLLPTTTGSISSSRTRSIVTKTFHNQPNGSRCCTSLLLLSSFVDPTTTIPAPWHMQRRGPPPCLVQQRNRYATVGRRTSSHKSNSPHSFARGGGGGVQRFLTSSSSSSNNDKDDTNDDTTSSEQQHAMFLQQMEDLKEERQALFGFTDQEQESWMQAQNHKHSSSLMEQIHQAREQQRQEEEQEHDSSEPNAPSNGPTTVVETNQEQPQFVVSQPFTHLQSSNTNTSTNQEDSWSIHMVNVGSKPRTERLAVAESRLVFPEHAWEALTKTTTTTTTTRTPTDLVGPKGPIFTTAKVAGILAAKYVCVVFVCVVDCIVQGWLTLITHKCRVSLVLFCFYCLYTIPSCCLYLLYTFTQKNQ